MKKNVAWMMLTAMLFSWQPLFSNQSGEGLNLPEVIVVGEDSARLEGFRDFSLLPVLVPGIKLEPVEEGLTLAVDRGVTQPDWRTASGPVPGCVYRNPVTASLARGLTGAEGYYRSGRQKYLEGLLTDAEIYFKAGLDKFADSELVPDFQYWLGEIALHREALADARRLFSAVTAATANHHYHFACYSLAWIDYREKNFARAAQWFAAAAQSGESRLAAASLFWQGEALFQSGQPLAGETALLRLTTAYQDSPEYRAALYRLATSAFNRRDYGKTLSFLEVMPPSTNGPDILSRQAELARAWALYFLGSWSAAENIFQTLLSPAKGNREVVPLAFLGELLALIKQGRLDQARQAFELCPPEVRESAVAAAALRELMHAFLRAEDSVTARELGRRLVFSFSPALLHAADVRHLVRLEHELGDLELALATAADGRQRFVAAGNHEAAAQVFLEKGQVLLAGGRASEALAVLRELASSTVILGADEDRFLLLLLLARSLNAVEDFPGCLVLLAEIPPQWSAAQRAELLYEKGWAALNNNDFELAEAVFSAYLGLVSELNTDLRLRQNAEINLIEALFNLHHDAQARARLDSFIVEWPGSSFYFRAQNYRALLALRQGDFEEAAGLLEALLEKEQEIAEPLRVEIMFNLGESFFSLEQFPQAIEIYQRLVDGYPANELSGQALIRMGESYFNQGSYLKAQLVYLKAKQLWPGGEIDEKASYGMLLLAYNQDKFSYLELEVKNFLARFPASSYNAPLLLLLADLYQRQERKDELISFFRELADGDYARDLRLEAGYRIFKLDLAAGRTSAAADACRRLLERFPFSKYECDCRLFLARQAFAAADFQGAAATLSGLEEHCPDPDLKRAVRLLQGRIFQVLGDFARSRAAFLAVIDEKRNDQAAFTAFAGLGALFATEGSIDEALFFYDKAMASPDSVAAAKAGFARATVLNRAGKGDEARQAYLRLAYLYPDQVELVVDALLAAAGLALDDPQTFTKIRDKLENLKLTPKQTDTLKKIVEENKRAD